MKHLVLIAACSGTLAGCGSVGANSSLYLNNGNDTSFLTQGSSACPGVAASNNPIYERYPLRCGPQAQVIPR